MLCSSKSDYSEAARVYNLTTYLRIFLSLNNFNLSLVGHLFAHSSSSPQSSQLHSFAIVALVQVRFPSPSYPHQSSIRTYQLKPLRSFYDLPSTPIVMAGPEISKQYVPLTCHGHSRPVTHLSFSGHVAEEEYYMISACKGSSTDGISRIR